MQKIIIDTDIGDDIDDILAIAFALLRSELDIKAITTVTTYSDKRAQMVKKLLRIAGKNDIPVGAGLELPLRKYTVKDYERMTNNQGYVLNQFPFVKPEDLIEDSAIEDAVDLIIRTIEQYPGEIGLIGIGPLSNIAVALQRKPSISKKLKWIALMGGEVHLSRAEHNIAWDSHSAEVVFASGVPLFLGTWDVTRGFVLMPEHCDIIKNHGTPLCDALSECIDMWWPYKAHKPGPVMYDIAPIIWSFNRDYYTTEPLEVHVETAGEFTNGMTVARGDQVNMEVTVDMREDDILKLFMSTVCHSK